MKKLFLIPLMTLMTCVMVMAGKIDYKALPMPNPDGTVVEAPAPAKAHKALMEGEEPANVAKIGETEYATLQAAFAAAEDGDVVELLADCSPATWYSGELDNTSITLKGNGHKITKSLIFVNETSSPMTITLDGVTVNSSSWYAYIDGNVTFVLAEGTTNAFSSSNSYGFYGYGNAGNITIQGSGTMTAPATYTFYQFGGVRIDAPNATFSNTAGYFGYQSNNVVLNAGSYGSNPADYVDLSSHVVTKPSTLYVVAAPAADVVAYNLSKRTTFTSIADAVTDAAAGQEIYMYKNDAAAVAVSKNLVVHTQGFSNNLSADAGYSKANVGNDIFFTDNALAAFLIQDGTANLTLTGNADISSAGAIRVHGNKTLTINEGVTVTYKRQGSLANIVVEEGAKLTVLGSGTFTPVMHSETRTIDDFTAEISSTASNQIGNRVIDVDGELVVGALKNGEPDANSCPHFITSSLARGSAVMVNETGVATINNADMRVANMSIKNYGSVTIHGGEYVSIATSQNGINGSWYAYHLNNEGRMIVNGGHFVGVQGAFANVSENAIVTINGGSFETVYGHNWATGASNVDNFYALYVACYSVVDIYGGEFKVQTPSLGSNKVVLVGNNDAYNTYGIVNMYGGKYQQKMEISARKNKDSSYPASIPTTSQWYSCFGSVAPLPAGYEYYEITEGEDYEAGYRYGVQRIPGKEADAIDPAQQAEQEADPEYTIPWQQSTTWATDEVPEENTIVTIPVGATVTVSKDEETKEAVADQVYVNQGATLVVEEGTVLNVGDGGVNVANGGQIVVEPGAIVTVGSAGLVTTEEEALVVESSETNQGAFLIAPAVTENTQPKATVKLTSKARQVADDEFVFERFAIPTINGSQTKYNAERLDTVTIYNDGSFAQGLYGWSGSAWAGVASFKDLEPFKGYQLTNTSKYGNVVYTFEGNLVGNQNNDFSFAKSGFGFFGNSYTGDIDIANFLGSFDSNMQKTIWVYDPYTDSFKSVTESSYGSVYYGTRANRHGLITDIRSMQAFLMNTFAEGASSTGVDYSSAIWGNPKYGLVSSPSPARFEDVNEDRVTVYVATETMEDEVTFIRRDEYSSEFDNGADASKWMNNNAMNLYVVTANGNLSNVATDNIEDITISFQSGNDTEYILGFDNLRGEEYSIRDIMTGVVTRMTEGATYNFTQEPNTLIEARFQIVGSRKVPTGVDNNATAPVMQKVMKNGTIYILRDADKFTIDGQSVK